MCFSAREDEKHFLMECGAYEIYRRDAIVKISDFYIEKYERKDRKM